MKKFFALALALVLTFAMAVTCFAADITSASGTKTQDVVIKYVAGDTAPETYAGDIAFEPMEFTYNAPDPVSPSSPCPLSRSRRGRRCWTRVRRRW